MEAVADAAAGRSLGLTHQRVVYQGHGQKSQATLFQIERQSCLKMWMDGWILK
jgi:uncharacterized membrane protein (UPF0127 family)